MGRQKEVIETVNLYGPSSLVFQSITKTMRNEPAVHRNATERLNTRVMTWLLFLFHHVSPYKQ